MSRTKVTALFAAAGLSGMIGCGSPAELDPEEVEGVENSKSDAFRGSDNPAYVGETFIYDPADLPVEAHTPSVPIAGDYWAVANDSINVRWNGSEELSPAEKVEKAFGLTGFAKHVTENFGIYQDGFTACKTNEDCKDETDKTASCVTPRVPETSEKPGRCVPSWWGICHGWAPYAVTEPAPKNPVVKNGVTFYPGDLTALMSFVYGKDLPTKFLSGRCNAFDKDLSTDSQGRVVSGECRDNPGTTFVIATNLIGKRKQGFVVDRTADYEVWNQPVEGYKITNAVDGKLKEINKLEAIGLLGLGFNYTQLVSTVDIAKDEEKKGEFIAPVAGDIMFKTTGTEGDADLFVKKGVGVTRENADCKSTGSSASEECKLTVAAGEKLTYLVFGYSASKKVALQVGVPGNGSNYTYNTEAKRFYHVEMDLYWVGEQRPGVTQPDPRGTLRTDHMSMILEADDKGLIKGGEWLGESKRKHTDFIWWPTAKPESEIAGLTYEMVKGLNDESVGSVPPIDAAATVVFEKADLKYTTAYDKQMGSIGAPAGTKKIEFTMTGTGGNADLYVRLGSKPTIYSFTAKSTSPTANETLTIDIPAAGATVYARARVPLADRAKTVNVKITAKLIK